MMAPRTRTMGRRWILSCLASSLLPRVRADGEGFWTPPVLAEDVSLSTAWSGAERRPMALSSDGLALAASSETAVGTYRRAEGVWTPQGEVPSGPAGPPALALSGDGGTLAALDVGSNGAEEAGRVRTYAYEDGAWVERGTIAGSAAFRSNSWASLALSADGGTIAVSLPFSDIAADAGQVQLYTFGDSGWKPKGSPLDGHAFFGYDVALSDDGNTVAVGDPVGADGALSGEVRVFRFQEGAWVPQGEALRGGFDARFGASVSLSGDGRTLAVGAQTGSDLRGVGGAGSVRVYRFDKEWRARGNALYGDQEEGRFGAQVSLSAAGDDLAVASGGGVGRAATFRYLTDYDVWVRSSEDVVPEDRYNIMTSFGYAMVLSGDAQSLAVSAGSKNSSPGRTYIYDYSPGLPSWYLEGPVGVQASNEAGGFTAHLSFSAYAGAAGYNLSLYYEDCAIPVDPDDVLQVGPGGRLGDGFLNATVLVDRAGIAESDAFASKEGAGASAGTVSFCVKAELLAEEGLSVSFRYAVVRLRYDMTDVAILLEDNELTQTVGDTDVEVADGYAVEACICRSVVEDECIREGELETLQQNGIVNVCLRPNSEEVSISNFDMRFVQEGENVLVPVYSGLMGPEDGELSTVVGDGKRYTVVSRLVSRLFQHPSNKFDIEGNAFLEYRGLDGRKRRRLVAVTSLRGRRLGESAGKTKYNLNVSLASIGAVSTGNNTAGVVSAVVVAALAVALGAVLFLRSKKKKAAERNDAIEEKDIVESGTPIVSENTSDTGTPMYPEEGLL
mmetsp:Transcript_6143/g.13266  ORF Transcript_6143/g.13266 Transcript_6143/m.13266 type:complete len:786 (-) Transcript_6143:200-2557(-)